MCILRVLVVKVLGACYNLSQEDSVFVYHFFYDGLKLWNIYQRGTGASLVLNDVV